MFLDKEPEESKWDYNLCEIHSVGNEKLSSVLVIQIINLISYLNKGGYLPQLVIFLTSETKPTTRKT